ncbi:MAG: formate dehydrogenase [Saprospiraceae bacterium]|nr:NAD(P)H-dependent oxidoreductase subunit E [Bacteroidia bacterium]NNE13355.1 formate dehydrogenase [Saprospiraceae bacterium]NNL91944.1 formate dehydrogenase [Saprospiraceae bacterium]
MSKNFSELSYRKGLKNNVFEEMTEIDDISKLKAKGKENLMGSANLLGAMSFYDFLKPENKGKKVYVCNGTACLCAGTQDEVINNLSSHFDESEIGHMTCLGRCYENSAFHYQGSNYSALKKDEIEQVIKGDEKDSLAYNVESSGTPVLTKPFEGIIQLKSLMQKSFDKGSQYVLDQIVAANVRGRGGAGFPMGIKLDGCRNQKSDKKYIICNADEGDPGAFSDRYLLEEQPFYVLFGMLMAGFTTGADDGILYIRAEYPDSVTVMEDAIAQLKENQLVGENILGSGFNFNFKIIQAQGAYICGEETALINSIEGQRPEVRTRPPYPVVQGLFNKPTIVNNVETLAAVYYILNQGANSFIKLGTEKSKGTKLLSLDSFFNKPGIYEVEMGTSLSKVFNELGGGFKENVKAVQIGGPLGGIVPSEKFDTLTVDFESFANGGFLLGHASVVCIPERMPMIKYLVHLMDFAAYESCGKCFPCRLGTQRAYEMLDKAEQSDYKIDKVLFDDLLTTLTEGSLCAHGGGIPLPVRNVLQYFENELTDYFE